MRPLPTPEAGSNCGSGCYPSGLSQVGTHFFTQIQGWKGGSYIRQKKTFRADAPVWAAFSPVILWLGALAACAYEDGANLIEFMGRFAEAVKRPFSVRWTAYTPRFLAGALLLYVCAIAFYYSTRQNRRPGEEHG